MLYNICCTLDLIFLLFQLFIWPRVVTQGFLLFRQASSSFLHFAYVLLYRQTETNILCVCVFVRVSIIMALMPHRQTDVSSSSPSGSGVIFLPSGTASQSAHPTTSQYHTHTRTLLKSKNLSVLVDLSISWGLYRLIWSIKRRLCSWPGLSPCVVHWLPVCHFLN